MKIAARKMLAEKHKTMPILSFPATALIGSDVTKLVTSSQKQAEGMCAIAERCQISAALNMMDLSVEAEAFGATIEFSPDDVPNVTKGIIDDISEAAEIAVPAVGSFRTGIYLEGVHLVKQKIKKIPVLCGAIGPYTLAGRLFDMTELMMACYDDADKVHILLEKCTDFLIAYLRAFREAGADGIVLAEPAAGLLSPSLCSEFSCEYVKRIFDEVGSEDFLLVYHNCGNAVPLIDTLSTIGADVYHFGNAVDMEVILQKMPHDVLVMGNINPVDFRNSTPEKIYSDTMELLKRCSGYDNFIISSGCDIPFDSDWKNIDAYFAAVKDFYNESAE